MKKSSFLILAAIPLVAIASIAVWKASGDDSRRQGALGSQEGAALSWRGDWNSEAVYARGNVVAHEGVTYVAEGEMLDAPKLDCSDCGWHVMAADSALSTPPENSETQVVVKDGLGESAYATVIERVTLVNRDHKLVWVQCPAGKVAVGGGTGSEQWVWASHPEVRVPSILPDPNASQSGWFFGMQGPELGVQRDISLYVACVKMP